MSEIINEIVNEDSKVNVEGAFATNLKRTNSQIKSDTAELVSEEAELHYRRACEDLHTKIRRHKRERDKILLKLSPTSAISNVIAADFDGSAYVNGDIATGVAIRQLEIQLEVARERYMYLFNKEINLPDLN